MESLNSRMEFGHVIEVHADGTVTDASVYGPESVALQLDSDGQSLDDDFIGVPEGWRAMTGYTGQCGYRGPVMHTSEFIGGRLERDILATPAFYVAAIVDGLSANDDDESDTTVGWAVFTRELGE